MFLHVLVSGAHGNDHARVGADGVAHLWQVESHITTNGRRGLTRFTSSYRSNCLGMQIPGNMYGRTEVMIEVSLDFRLPSAL